MESFRVGLPTVVLVLAYLVGVNVLGIWVAWPWYSLIGSLSGLAMAWLFSRRHAREKIA
jgi:predicted branched-subunit amino acid permease